MVYNRDEREATMNRRELATDYFLEGYNCSQAVALAFSDLIPVEKDTLLSMMSSFGGGMGRLREVCGAVSAIFAVAGILYGYSGPETGDVKMNHYARIQFLAAKFEEQWGSIVCRDLLGLSQKKDDPKPAPRTKEYYGTRPCPAIIGDAAEILENFIKDHPIGK